MGKATYKGLVPQDDPMFFNGTELFSRPKSSESLTNTPSNMVGATRANPSSTNAPETEAEGKELGAHRIARFKHQNEQMRKQSKDLLQPIPCKTKQ
jgi:hypothetical protein